MKYAPHLFFLPFFLLVTFYLTKSEWNCFPTIYEKKISGEMLLLYFSIKLFFLLSMRSDNQITSIYLYMIQHKNMEDEISIFHDNE